MRYFAPAFFAYGQFFTFKQNIELDVFAFAAVFPRILTTLHCRNLKHVPFTLLREIAFIIRVKTTILHLGEVN
jgi:hypothetical protein